ncbi:unnamed protein product [Didymodactylos carnosus]|uniref:Uncharacterized protein n=1 Tax=Didymodactylos carnosus TaxID=1234261 RepID=A0A8S2W8G9_9BILA|nr:unnamed protein product [Didymodactylos carnosus]
MDRNRKPYKKISDFEIEIVNGIFEQGLITPKDIVEKLLQESYGDLTNYYKSINKATQPRRVNDILIKIAKKVALARSSDNLLFAKQNENSESTDAQMIVNSQACNNQIAIREQETDIESQEERESKPVTPCLTSKALVTNTSLDGDFIADIIQVTKQKVKQEPGSHRVRSDGFEDTQNVRPSSTQWTSNRTATASVFDISSVPKQKINKVPKTDRPLTINDVSNQEEEEPVVRAAAKKRKTISPSARVNTLLSRIENVLDPFEGYT